MTLRPFARAFLLAGALGAGACDTPDPSSEAVAVDLPPGFAPLPVPPHAPLTPERVELGRRLFFDPVLSRDRTVACASCHAASRAFTDGRAVAVGIGGQTTLRNAPSLLNAAYRTHLHWDGGASTLEAQALAPLEAENEMAADLAEVLRRLDADVAYAAAFRDAFGEGPSVRTLTLALGTYQRTLVSQTTAYDRARTGDSTALSDAARRGLRLFAGRAGCAACHAGPLLTDASFADNGLARNPADSGRARITLQHADAYRFRVPSLRAAATTAPYMHDGRFATLGEVVDHYDRGGSGLTGQDGRIRPLHLTPEERADLVAFLQTLDR